MTYTTREIEYALRLNRRKLATVVEMRDDSEIDWNAAALAEITMVIERTEARIAELEAMLEERR